MSLRWDTTTTFASAFRIAPANADLLADVNADDGDRAFAPGLVSSRFDVLSELEADWRTIGARLSVQGWYDPVYFARTANSSPATFNPVSVPSTEFTRATRRQEGLDGEVLDAFVRADVPLGGGRLSVRLGQFAVVWGETLFLFENGIGAALAPVDIDHALADPEAPAWALYRPVPQLSAAWQAGGGWLLEGVLQPVWRRDRLPAVGSFFSTQDYLDAGGERLLTPIGRLPRAPDATPGGLEGGAALHWTGDWGSVGLYAIRADARTPQVVLIPGAYRLTFAPGIDLFGLSFSAPIGGVTLAGEVSGRRGAPLANLILPGHTVPPRGDTLHSQLSLQTAFGTSRWWNDAALAFEVGANERLAITEGAALFDTSRTRWGGAARGVLQLSYFQVLPGLDLLPSLGLGAGLFGRSSLAETAQLGAGDATLALEAVLRSKWRARLAATHFLGRYERQPLADRDFVSLSLQRSF